MKIRHLVLGQKELILLTSNPFCQNNKLQRNSIC